MDKAIRHIIITGDDFGSSHAVNQAIIQAHERGILTSASLMVSGDAFEEALDLAHQHPRLAVGLHLVLVSGRATLPRQRIPHLVDKNGWFSSNPFLAGALYQCHAAARREVRREIRAQLEKFQQTGLKLSHVDGHRHMHLPPFVLGTLIELSPEFSIRAIRFPSEELSTALAIDRNNFLEKSSLSFAFKTLGLRAKRRLRSAGIRCLDRVYGLLQSGRVTEDYLLQLIPQIRAGWVEIYSHPTIETNSHSLRGASGSQLAALLSDRVRRALVSHGFRLASYFDLNGCAISS